MRIYLADLTHTTMTLSIDTMPLGIGYMAAYAKSNTDKDFEFELFRYPEDFFDAVDRHPPDVVGVTNYCWNYELNTWALEYARKINPNLVTVMGGPNFPVDHDLQEQIIKKNPHVNFWVLGDGERVFLNIIETLEEQKKDVQPLYSIVFDNCLYYDALKDKVVRGEGFGRIPNLDHVPSPYQMGLMDKFFDGKLNPFLQTNRGCPFTCTFCLEGNPEYNKVHQFGIDRVKSDLEYISDRAHSNNTLFLADSNFGMYPKDVEIAEYIRGLQETKKWPKFINCTTGKNKPEQIVHVNDLVNNAIRISSSVQSMDSKVLENVRRRNIKLDAYAKIQEKVRERKMQSLADLILCLPGETKESHFLGIKQLLDAGVQRILPYQLMLLHGTQLNTKETRSKYKYKTKYRVVPRNFGYYRDKVIFETEEICVATESLSFEDYLDCRRFHLILQAYYRENPFEELIAFVNVCGIKTSDFFLTLLDRLDQAPGEMKDLFANFVRETQEELFDSREELIDFMQNHIDELKEGSLGGNLLQKYSSKLWFEKLEFLVDHATEQAKYLISPKCEELNISTQELDQQLESIGAYLKAIYVNVFDMGDIRKCKEIAMVYDVPSWKHENYAQMLKHYNDTPPSRGGSGPCSRDYVFSMSDEQAEYVEKKIGVFGNTPQGIGKMMTRMFLRDLRRTANPAKTNKPS